MPEKESRKYIERLKELKHQRLELEDVLIDIRDYILPRTGMFFDEENETPMDYEDRYDMILDSTASRAMRVITAGMQGGLTSPSRPWFRLGLENEGLMQIRAIKEWLREVEKIMYARFSASNFYNAIHRVYEEEAAYGTAVLIMEEDDEDMLRYTVLTAGEYWVAEDDRNIVKTLYRQVWMQANQMEERFGRDKLPEPVRRELEEDKGNPYKWFKVIHVIQPRKGADPNKVDNQNMPFESIWIEHGGDEKIIDKGGFREDSMAVPRWSTSGSSPYGRSPGHDVLPDVKQLQEITGDKLAALQKVVDPPLKSGGGLKGEVSHMAGTVTYTESANVADSLKPIFEVRFDLGAATAEIQDLRMQIREGLFNDLFLMLVEPKPNMTATEVAERHEEKLLMLGPVIERQFHELLNPVIDKMFDVLMENGLLPPIPPELQNAVNADPTLSRIKVEYISLLAQAQKLVTTQAIRATSDYIASMAQFKPEALDKLNVDKAIDEYAEATGAPPAMIYSDEIVQQVRRLRQQMLIEEQRRREEAEAAQGMKVMSETDTEGDNALTQLQENLQPA